MEKGQQTITNILFAGVGGQGILLASDLSAQTALLAGMDVKKSEVHGMAQRGGSVVSHVRFGNTVASPLIPEGEADFLVSFEEMESLRYISLMRPGGTIILNRQRIYTLSMLTGDSAYPDGQIAGIEDLPARLISLDGPSLAREAGNPRTANIVILGALAACLPFEMKLWMEAMERRLPEKFLEINRKAFELGMAVGKNR